MPEPQSPLPIPGHWQQIDRLATIGTLTAGVAHELNNPIGFILSNLASFQHYLPIFIRYFDILQAIAGAETPEQKSALQQQLQALQQQDSLQFLLQDTQSLLHDSLQGALRVRDLVLDLRRFSHPDHAEMQALELKPLLELALRLCKNEIKNHIQVELSCAPLQLNGQPAALTQVFVNLIQNAAQAIGTESGQIRLSATVTPDGVELRVEDSGPGIPEHQLQQIFTPFFTTKPAGKGTGLGLPICQSIIQQHQGALSVERSTLGGAAFVLRLPAITASAGV